MEREKSLASFSHPRTVSGNPVQQMAHFCSQQQRGNEQRGFVVQRQLNFVVDSFSLVNYWFNLFQPIQSYFDRERTLSAEYR